MAFVVKNTTENGLLDILCPHYCMGCGRLGSLLCERCKKYLKQELSAQKPPQTANFYVCGRRTGLLQQMVETYKYAPVRGLAKPLAALLAETLPEDLPENTIIVPLPTIPPHVRARGFDHITLLAKNLAKLRGFRARKLLLRTNTAVQVGASAKARQKQAETAYALAPRAEIDSSATYLLLDDVSTTGASLQNATKILNSAGATDIRQAVLAVSQSPVLPHPQDHTR